ncbi:MAG: type II secretion system protein [Clostridia bacterium]|nr:type II secretion system protein [Clostridia bacterium]
MMKGQKGITLVALVITIIVMLILVAVSVSVALNGGLFDKAKEAGKDYQNAQANEANSDYVTYEGLTGLNAINEAANLNS